MDCKLNLKLNLGINKQTLTSDTSSDHADAKCMYELMYYFVSRSESKLPRMLTADVPLKLLAKFPRSKSSQAQAQAQAQAHT